MLCLKWFLQYFIPYCLFHFFLLIIFCYSVLYFQWCVLCYPYFLTSCLDLQPLYCLFLCLHQRSLSALIFLPLIAYFRAWQLLSWISSSYISFTFDELSCLFVLMFLWSCYLLFYFPLMLWYFFCVVVSSTSCCFTSIISTSRMLWLMELFGFNLSCLYFVFSFVFWFYIIIVLYI